MRRSVQLLVLCVALAAAPAVPASESADFVVVVHPDNPTESLDRRQLSRIFLRVMNVWNDGGKIEPVDQAPESPVRRAFSKAIHGKSTFSIQSYWQRRIFSGQSTPPTELPSDQKVLEIVRREPGAIGYVSADARLTGGVKVLGIDDLPGYDEVQPGPGVVIATEWESVKVVLSGSCGFEGRGRQAVLRNRDPDRAMRVTVETSVRGDGGLLRASSVEDHTLGPREEKPLGCTQADAYAEERRYTILGVSLNG
ncbi:MAG: hypothetical protein GY719_08940 [bacterium]|nr:hypothetical protein [bacterium]